MKLALIGLANSGRTTLLNALTGLDLPTQAFPTTEGEPHRAVVKVPDDRVDALNRIYSPRKTTFATIDYVDFMGLIRGEREQNRRVFDFLRDADALVHVIRAFQDDGVLHPLDGVDPLRDFEVVEQELVLADLELVETRLERIEEGRRRGRPQSEAEERVLLRCREILESEQPLRHAFFSSEESKALQHLQFVSDKPLLPVVNVGEGDCTVERRGAMTAAFVHRLARYPEINRPTPLICSARIEMEIAQLAPEEAGAFLADLGIAEPARMRLIRASYGLLGLISFLTVGEDEVRAWTIPLGTPAVKAAGKIHSDLARGFIRAEVMAYRDFMAHGADLSAVRKAGRVRLEGKTYEVADGDIINFKFNV
jgi:GTP-binding protein YchF